MLLPCVAQGPPFLLQVLRAVDEGHGLVCFCGGVFCEYQYFPELLLDQCGYWGVFLGRHSPCVLWNGWQKDLRPGTSC